MGRFLGERKEQQRAATMPIIHYEELPCCRQSERVNIVIESEVVKANRTNVVWINASEKRHFCLFGSKIAPGTG